MGRLREIRTGRKWGKNQANDPVVYNFEVKQTVGA